MDLKRIPLNTSGYPGTDQKTCVVHTRLKKAQGVAVTVLAVCGLLQLATKPVTHLDRQVHVLKSYDGRCHFADLNTHNKPALSLTVATHHAHKNDAYSTWLANLRTIS